MFGAHGHRRAYRVHLFQGEARGAILFLTANKADGAEGKVICVKHRGRRHAASPSCWLKLSARTSGGKGDFAIDAGVRLQLPGGPPLVRAAAAVSWRKWLASWIDLYSSADGGRNWRFLNRPGGFSSGGATVGNPPCLKRLWPMVALC